LHRREQQAMDEAAGRMFQHPARRGVS
jgi:flagellar biosynthesis chaperone FliJ